MADQTPDLTAARLAVLEVTGWPDDRGQPAIDGVPAEAHWSLASEIVAAVAPPLIAEGHRQAADAIRGLLAFNDVSTKAAAGTILAGAVQVRRRALMDALDAAEAAGRIAVGETPRRAVLRLLTQEAVDAGLYETPTEETPHDH